MSTFSLALWTGILQTTLGGCGHTTPRGTVVAVDACAVCDVESVKVANAIHCLQTAREWRRRDAAALELSRYGPRRHPELIDALALALLKDPHEEVREEAAESLKKHGICSPVAHFALTKAAKCDPDHATRRMASKALKAFNHRCTGPCRICSPNAIVIGPGSRANPLVRIEPVPDLPIEERFPDSPDLQPAPPLEAEPQPGRSPFAPAPVPPPAPPAEDIPPPLPQPARRIAPSFPPLVAPTP